MALILLIETTTDICSAALTKNGSIINMKELTEPNAHSANLTSFIKELIETSDINFSELDAIAVSAGPGSYTGLRIGVSTAKGICYALDKPLISINTLESFAFGIKSLHVNFQGYFCPMIDARRMEVYSAVFDSNLNLVRNTEANIIDEDTYKNYLGEKPVLFFGSGAPKSFEILKSHENAYFDLEFQASAKWMLWKAEQKFKNQDFEDVAYFEPFYLKDFIANKPSVKGLYNL